MKKAVYFNLFYFIAYIVFLIIAMIKKMNIVLIIVIILAMAFELDKIIFSIKNNKNKKKLMKNGKKIRISVNVYQTFSIKPSCIRCKGKWTEPTTNVVYTYKTDRYLDSNILYPKELDVYIDESNPKKYYMAFEEEKNKD